MLSQHLHGLYNILYIRIKQIIYDRRKMLNDRKKYYTSELIEIRHFLKNLLLVVRLVRKSVNMFLYLYLQS